jgi:hypothetical protein
MEEEGDGEGETERGGASPPFCKAKAKAKAPGFAPGFILFFAS